eukprot:scaffold1813_cov185-Alexandrium_tamarense.AAC.15
MSVFIMRRSCCWSLRGVPCVGLVDGLYERGRKTKWHLERNHDTHSLKQTATPRYVTRRIADAKRITTTPEPPQHGFDNTV